MRQSLVPRIHPVRLLVAVAAIVGAMPGTVLAGAVSGQAPSPALDPSSFVRHVDNPWFPLTPGTTLVYRGTKDGEKVTDIYHVLSRTKRVQGVRATVVEDTLVRLGQIVEHTFDWYAQDRQGRVWYLGENTAEYNAHGMVVSREGSWQSGVDGAQAGIFMPAHPQVGQTFRQEYFPGHAEDHFRVIDTSASVTVPYGTFTHALRTREWTPLEPGVRDAKYYAKGIGEVAELTEKGPREVLRLVQLIRP